MAYYDLLKIYTKDLLVLQADLVEYKNAKSKLIEKIKLKKIIIQRKKQNLELVLKKFKRFV